MISAVLKHINNYFYMHDLSGQIIADRNTFIIENGVISPIAANILVGQYIRLKNSVLNDGIYRVEHIGDRYIDVALRDEDYPQWVKQTGAVDAYRIDDRVTHNNVRYISLINANIWEPGTDIRWWQEVGEEEHSTHDEIFQGMIIPLRIPRDFLALMNEIEVFEKKARTDKNRGIVTSESFGGWSASYAATSNGVSASWIEVYSSRLNKYRKMFEEKVI